MKAHAESLPASSRVRPLVWLARIWEGLRLRDAIVLTILPLLVIALLVGDAAYRFNQYLAFGDWWSLRADVPTFLNNRLQTSIDLPARVALRQQMSRDANDAGVMAIDVPTRDWVAMQGDGQAMWGEWVDATLTYGGTLMDVRLRKRGDNSVHWLTDKRSLTVRTTREEFYKNFRQFALSGKDVLPAYLANRLAQEFDLVAPQTEVVPVFLNSQFYGMFRFIEVVDEGFLRSVSRMPGNIFRGDTAERGDVFKGVPRNLFENPYIWDRVALNERPTAAGPDQLRLMLEDLHGGTFEDHLRLVARFDAAEHARLFAYLLIAGDPYHASFVNNQFLYEDPSTQLLHPIPWDTRLRDVSSPGGPLNDLFRELLRNPWIVDGTLREVERALSERRIEDVAERLAVSADTRYRDYFEFDRLRRGMVPDVGYVERSVATIRANGRTLRQWLAVDEVAFSDVADGAVHVLDFETRGLVGADLAGFDGGPFDGRARVFRDANLNGVLDAQDAEIPATAARERLTLAQPLPLFATWTTDAGRIGAGRMPYRLFVTGAGSASFRPRLTNRVTGKVPAIGGAGVPGLPPLTAGQPVATPSGWHPWRYPAPRPVIHRYAGDVRLSETVRIPAGDTVVVLPGTTFRLDPDVSFIARGQVKLAGTADRPVRFVPAVSGRPWGAFTLLGSGADGSVLRHAEFVEGGGALVDRIEYIGMVNVHRARGVTVESVQFIRNRRSDDTFHALHAEVTLANCRFVDANSDAVDFDISSGVIRDNTFEGSGGDAIDLMTSTPLVIGNRIRRAGDKGISVGEDSSPVVVANVVTDSVTGIAIKDHSAPIILNNEVRANGVGLAVYAKNWRYGGSGFGLVVNTRFENNETPLDADALARLTLWGVVGLDSETQPPAPAAVDWLYTRLGLEITGQRIGLPASVRVVPPRPAVADLRFKDNFGSVADGWTRSGRVTRVEKREDVLRVDAEGGAGAIHRDVSWDLSSNGGTFVLEIAGRDVRRVRVVVESDRGRVEREAAVHGDPDRFSLIELALPAGRYRRVTIEQEPTPGVSHIQPATGLSVLRAGRLLVRSVAVYAAPTTGSAGAAR